MRLLILILGSLLQCYSSFAQVYFSQPNPVAEEVIMGGVPFIVSVAEPLSAPYFTQMADFNLLLYTGNISSPVSIIITIELTLLTMIFKDVSIFVGPQ
jgi:hypothetical protein